MRLSFIFPPSRILPLSLCLATSAFAAPGDKQWEFVTDGAVSSSPAIDANGRLYIGSMDSNVYALNRVTGKKLWAFTTGGGVPSSPAIGVDGTVYVGALDNKIYALDGATGQKRWEYGVWGVYSSPAIGADGTVFIGSLDNNLYALDGALGLKKWAYATRGFITSSPAVGSDGTVYVGSRDSKVYALNGTTGAWKWEFKTGAEVYASPCVGSDGTVYIGSSDRVYALDGATGATKWSFNSSYEVFCSPVLGADNTVYIGSNYRKAYAVNQLNGAKKWEFPLITYLNAAPAVGADGTVYLGANDNRVCALNGATGNKIWEFQTGGQVVSSPTIGPDGTVYVGANDKKVYAFEGNRAGGLAESPWPKFHRNLRNTGQMPFIPRITGTLAADLLAEGSSTNLILQVLGDPAPALQWYLNGRPILGATGSTYAITAATANHAGIYYLKASNELGVAISQQITVGVYSSTVSNMIGIVLNAPVGASLQLQCADGLRTPAAWRALVDLILPASPCAYADLTATNTRHRFYRSTLTNALDIGVFPGWTINAPQGSRYRVEYLEPRAGNTNWQLLQEFALPASPFAFLDLTATNGQTRQYRTTPLQ